jgi:hypothetical protein
MTISTLWSTRKQSERALNEELAHCANLSVEIFLAIDDLINRLEKLNQPFGRVCALVLIKARNLGLGCYSLFLDALGQEAGALLRPILECQELLAYFRLDPGRIEEALEDRLPSAGCIAKKIEGQIKFLRDYLNTHASHLSLAPEATAHLIDFREGYFKKVQSYKEDILCKNILLLLSFLVWIEIEAVNCISVGEDKIDFALVDRVEDLKNRVLILHDQQELNKKNS